MTESIGPDEEIAYDTLIERARKEGGKLMADFRRRGLASRETMEKWSIIAARGDRARSFLTGDFWRKDMEPLLRAEARIKPAAADALPASLERATIEYLDKSGAARQAEKLERTMREWVSEGDKANELLRAEREKRKALAPSTR
jgi:hypothetical protein